MDDVERQREDETTTREKVTRIQLSRHECSRQEDGGCDQGRKQLAVILVCCSFGCPIGGRHHRRVSVEFVK